MRRLGALCAIFFVLAVPARAWAAGAAADGVAATGDQLASLAAGAAARGRALVAPLTDQVSALVGYADRLSPPGHVLTVARAAEGWWRQRRRCTPASVAPPPPPSGHVLIEVGGLGST